MKKELMENESDSLVIDEIPNIEVKKRIIDPSKKSGSDKIHDDPDNRSLDEELAKRKTLLKNFSKGVPKDLKEWQQQLYATGKKHNTLIAETIPPSDLMIFQLNDDHTTVKTEWPSLPSRLKEVFEEIIYSLPISGLSNENDDGCYTFSYTDDEFNISVISIVIEGKAALFYKNADSPNL